VKLLPGLAEHYASSEAASKFGIGRAIFKFARVSDYGKFHAILLLPRLSTDGK